MHIERAKKVLDIEIQGLEEIKNRIDDIFSQVVELILASRGRVVITGVGKSGIIGKKISATLSSTGTPSFFLHPTEAFHGDLGMIQADDIILAISYSGETEELLRLLPIFISRKYPIISLTGNIHSSLAKHSRFVLDISVSREACVLDLAPTASTTACLAMGDSLAVCLLQAKDFRSEDFAFHHPGGNLGKKLLQTAEQVMFTDNLPLVFADANMKNLIDSMTKGKLGLALVISINEKEEHVLEGIVTDGDLRRAMDNFEEMFFTLQARDIMTSKPKSVLPEMKIIDAEALMIQFCITCLPVVRDGILVGVLQMYSIGNG